MAPDYYAVLQVHPDADFEVIEAAYRQLIKKHHPDMAGDDPQRIAEHLRRAKAINEAFSVLRDPERRRRYDLDRLVAGTVRPPSEASRPTRPPPPPRTPPSPPRANRPPVNESAVGAAAVGVQPAPESSWLVGPVSVLSAAYYLLPGAYEWEPGNGRELLTVIVLPPLALAGFLLASGRLTPLLGHSLPTNLAAWFVLGLFGVFAMWGSVLRVAMASVPTLALLSGWLNPYLAQSHVPVVIAWGLLSGLSLILAARLYVFGVVPSLAVIWLVARSS